MRKILMKSQQNYSIIDKLAFTLKMAFKKLRHYFGDSTIVALTSHLLKNALKKLDVSRRLAHIAIELSVFYNHLKPPPVIKGQVVANFITDGIERKEPIQVATLWEKQGMKFWEVFIDGANNAKGEKVGIVIFIIDGGVIEQSIRITFSTINNVVECEVVLLALQELRGLGAEY